MTSPVDRLHSDFEALVALLDQEPSLRATADDNFRKSILLSAASYFEFTLSEAVQAFAIEASNSSELLGALVKRKAIDRQYHTWFDWERSNANAFYRLFGETFCDFMKHKHASEEWLDPAVRAFMELGRSRNLLVHGNYGAFSLEKTASEIYDSYKLALRFVEAVPALLRDCNGKTCVITPAG